MLNFKKILSTIIAVVLVCSMLPMGALAEMFDGIIQLGNAEAGSDYAEWKLPMNWATGADKDDKGWEIASMNNGIWRLTSFTNLDDTSTMRWKPSTDQLVDSESHSKSPESYLESFANRDVLSGASAGWANWYVNFGTRHQKKNFGFGDNFSYIYAYPGNGSYNNSAIVFTAPKDATYDYTSFVALAKSDAAVTVTVRKNGTVLKTETPNATGSTVAGSVALQTGDLLMIAFTLTNTATVDDNNPAVKISDVMISYGEKPADYDKPEGPDWSDITPPVYPVGEEPLLVIGTISDSHTDYGLQNNNPYIRPAYINGLKTLKQAGVDLVLHGGDITSDNEDAQKTDFRWDKSVYDRTVSQYKEYTSAASKTGISLWACGNHDHEVGRLSDGKISEGDYDSYAGFIDIMKDTAGTPVSVYTQKQDDPNTPSIYADRWVAVHYVISGFDFIVINAPYASWQQYSSGTLEWLDKTLAGIGEEKTVFINGHYPLADNRGVTNPSSYGIKDDAYDRFVKVMNKYDNAIYLYGHNHGKSGSLYPYINSDTFERITHYDAAGVPVNNRDTKPSSFITAFMGSIGYYDSSLGAADPAIVQVMTISVFADRIEFKMINCGASQGTSRELATWTVKRHIVEPDHEDGPAANTNGVWELGDIAANNGNNTSADNRVRFGRYLNLADFSEVSVKSGYKLLYFAYDHNYAYLGNNGSAWSADGGSITTAAIKAKYPGAVYFKIVMAKTDNGNMTIADVADSNAEITVNASAPVTEHTYNGAPLGIKLEFANGAILANGKIDKKASGQYCKTYLPLNEYSAIAGDGNALVKYFVYDSKLNIVGSGATDLSKYSVTYLKNSYPSAVYFRFNITTSGKDAILQTNPNAMHKFTQQIVGYVEAQQDGALYGGKLFMFDKEGNCNVTDYATGEALASFTLGSTNKIKPFCNAVSFSDVFYAQGDKYPLLYANVYNTYADATDRKEGHLCVYRIKENGTTFTAELVQVIKIGFVNDLSLWKSEKNNGDVRSYGNFVIDTDKNELIAFVARDANRTTRFFRFKLPSVTAGTTSSAYGCKVVTLNKANIVGQFDVQYIPYIQGCTYYDGNVISVSGMVEEGKIHIINLASGTVAGEIDCYSLGLLDEPQMVDVDRSTGKIIYTATDKIVRLFEFEKYVAPTAKEVYETESKPSTTTPPETTPSTTPEDTTAPSTTEPTTTPDNTTVPSTTTNPSETTATIDGADSGESDNTLLITVLIGVGCVLAIVVIWVAFGPKKAKK